MSDAVLAAREERGGLTFEWGQGKGGRPFWLIFFLFVSLLGHAMCFYLFQVVYPPQKRELLRPVEVTVLDPRDPLTSDVLARIDDRVVAIDARGSLEVPGEGERPSAAEFHPFFEGYEPALRDLPPAEGAPKTLFVPGRFYLPPPTGARGGVAPDVATAASPMKPTLSLRWVGSRREVVRAFRWAPKSPVARPDVIDHAVFYIGIDAMGRIVHSLPEQSAGTEIDTALHAALRGVQFEPGEGQRIQWAWADFRW